MNLFHIYLLLFDSSQHTNIRKYVPQGLLYYYISRQKTPTKMTLKMFFSACALQML